MKIEKMEKKYFYPNEQGGWNKKKETSLPLTDLSPIDLISDGATLECKLITSAYTIEDVGTGYINVSFNKGQAAKTKAITMKVPMRNV